jgi:hypothetical protein
MTFPSNPPPGYFVPPPKKVWWRQTWVVLLIVSGIVGFLLLMIGAVSLWLFASADSHVTRSTPAKCKPSDRTGLSSPCPPTPTEIAAASGIPVPAQPMSYTSTYEGFTDWNQQAKFQIPVADVSKYTSLPDFPGVTIGGPAVEASRELVQGQHRTLQLTSFGSTVEVTIVIFTT